MGVLPTSRPSSGYCATPRSYSAWYSSNEGIGVVAVVTEDHADDLVDVVVAAVVVAAVVQVGQQQVAAVALAGVVQHAGELGQPNWRS